MAFKFNQAVYQSTGTDFNYESVGTLASNCKGYSLKFSKRNLASDKRVTLLLRDKKGVDFTLSCSAPLSKLVRKAISSGTPHNKVLTSLLKLDIMQDQDDESKYFLCQPQGDGEMLPSYEVDTLAKDKESTFEDILATAVF
jgi:hypothetical protein